jgi:hypothetical protein
VVMSTEHYIKEVLSKHLLTKDYKQLSETEVRNRMKQVKYYPKSIIHDHQGLLSKAELTYFKRNLQEWHRLPIFYGLPKVHITPTTLTPVVSGTNSLLAFFSNWLEYKMKELLPFVQSYIKDSFTVITELKQLHIPNEPQLFSEDASSMCTNIDTILGITALTNYINLYKERLPSCIPTELFIGILTTVMENNIFSFGDTFWLQTSGTAMGITPSACTYVMIFFWLSQKHNHSHHLPLNFALLQKIYQCYLRCMALGTT